MDLFEALFLVVQEVLVLLQTKLERARLVERARLALVRGVHHGLQHALVELGQVDRVVRHNLHSKISFTTLDYGLSPFKYYSSQEELNISQLLRNLSHGKQVCLTLG